MLDNCGGDHGESGNEEAGANALERGDSGVGVGEAAGEGDEGGLVERDEEDEDYVRDGLEGSRGDLERVGEECVHGGSLLDRECLKLS